MRFGLHTGPQNCSYAELVDLWRYADTAGFHWISIWDHFYPAMITPQDAEGSCFEAVSIMTALACETRRVRVGCLVFCMAYRHPAVLANALATLDHVSGGRVEAGLGAGWSQIEFDAYGIPFLPIRDRLDQLEEGIQVIRALLTQPVSNFEGRHYRLREARCEPKPLQHRLRLWVGGMGERRLLRIVAQYADGWNVPFIAPEVFAQKNAVLTQWCEKLQRDPTEITRTVNVGLAIARNETELARKRDGLRQQFGAILEFMEPGMLVGTVPQVIDRVGEYQKAGADWVIVALRAPFDREGLQLFVEEVLPAFAG
ncbi:MAG: TIGR03560 family F420-dependent LLM class oxidoreductase [Candidatus Binatia bacterium]|nr:TIGR03560 family F420-dependent LLM class oxidoreductase [Candidatus Binatia bacterium]